MLFFDCVIHWKRLVMRFHRHILRLGNYHVVSHTVLHFTWRLNDFRKVAKYVKSLGIIRHRNALVDADSS